MSPRSKRDLRGTWTQALLSLGSAILMVLAIRWAFFEPYVIPSGSMIPTLLIHDHILVNKLAFGIRLPFTSQWLVRWSEPKRGDVLVFRSIEEDGIFLVKRVIGLPGDEISLDAKGDLLVNGKTAPRVSLTEAAVRDELSSWPEEQLSEILAELQLGKETLDGRKHWVARDLGREETRAPEGPWKVPAGKLFMMGDNRDNSSDSRVWGALSMDRVLGRATAIWLSCEETLPDASQLCDPKAMRWHRLFTGIE